MHACGASVTLHVFITDKVHRYSSSSGFLDNFQHQAEAFIIDVYSMVFLLNNNEFPGVPNQVLMPSQPPHTPVVTPLLSLHHSFSTWHHHLLLIHTPPALVLAVVWEGSQLQGLPVPPPERYD